MSKFRQVLIIVFSFLFPAIIVVPLIWNIQLKFFIVSSFLLSTLLGEISIYLERRLYKKNLTYFSSVAWLRVFALAYYILAFRIFVLR